MVMLGPPFTIEKAQIDEAVAILSQALESDLMSGTSRVMTF